MANIKKIWRIVMSATTTTNAVPTVSRYFYQQSAAISNTVTLNASSFHKDNGSPAATFVTAAPNNGYYLLFVNGTLQQSSMYTVAPTGTGITITVSPSFTIPASSVVTLATTNFAPASTTTVVG